MANEKRLIDADALKREIMEMPWSVRKAETNGKEEIEAIINDAPTVDAVEVVHGEWTIIEDDYLCLTSLECSVCGEQFCFEEYDEEVPPHYHYCPNCGAKMDGDGNG